MTKISAKAMQYIQDYTKRCSNELVSVEDELRLYKDIEKMENQPIHKEPITTFPEWDQYRIERKTIDEEIRRMYQTTGVESTQNVTYETNEETNLK